jgi:hypothetical protein
MAHGTAQHSAHWPRSEVDPLEPTIGHVSVVRLLRTKNPLDMRERPISWRG